MKTRTTAARFRTMILPLACAACAAAEPPASRPAAPSYRGVDISMLPEIERAGGVFRDDAGARADAIAVFRGHGVNMFRVRLFVGPGTDFNKSWGATQDLSTVRALAKRIKAGGGMLMLDLHYSDTWADGEHQTKPKSWAGLSAAQLEQTVHDYTAGVLWDLADAGAAPDVVAIGNEIAGGMIWPEGKLLGASEADAPLRWAQLARFLNSGARAVREAGTAEHPIAVMVHIHGGGRPKLAQWFFGKLKELGVDYDLIGLSVYPAWGDSLEVFEANLGDLARSIGKPVVAAEVGYPWKPEEGVKRQELMRWPQTPEGQAQFVADLTRLMRRAPGAAGFVWWYPEAVPTKGLSIWRQGAEALFDTEGRPLPALRGFEDRE